MSIVNKTFTRRQVLAGLGMAAVASAASPFASSVTASAATKKALPLPQRWRGALVWPWSGPVRSVDEAANWVQTIMEPVPYNSYGRSF